MNWNKANYMVAITSMPQDTAEHIAHVILSERLAACVQILGPVSSLFWWEGKIQKDTEALLFLKTKKSCIDKIKEKVTTMHPYEVPELIFLPVDDGLPAYMEWMDTIIENKKKK
jgi:periplasmic divalent cation tolerance protein